jgi:hypothetical protein
MGIVGALLALVPIGAVIFDDLKHPLIPRG